MKNTARLRRRILGRDASVAVIGQGYVGLSLALVAAEAGYAVRGVDVDEDRTRDLSAGIPCVAGVSEDAFRAGIATGNITFTTDETAISGADIVAVCVPTPLRDQAPDLSFVRSACESVARNLAPGMLAILESTTYPGTTEELVRPILETSGLVAGRDFSLAYSPERIDPGNEEFVLANTPRVVGGLTPESTGLAAVFYEQLVEKVVVVTSARVAELAKLLENTFRHVNIALVNEMAMLCHDMGIDIWEVIDAAASKPFGFMMFTPGPGVGGHCIPLDPSYLAWQVRRDAGRQFRILEEAQEINTQMPLYVVERLAEVLNDQGLAVRNAKLLLLGIGYKPDIGDLRESPSLRVMELLKRRGATVSFHDPFFTEISVAGETIPRTELSSTMLDGVDVVVLLTAHSAYDLEWLGANASLVFDARNAMGPQRRPNVVRL